MRIIKKDISNIKIVLEENDVLEVSTLYGNRESLFIKCLDLSLHIDELAISKIKEKCVEEKEINKMKKFLNKRK